MQTNSGSPLNPSTRLLCKIGSIAVHADEFLSDDGHHFDRAALEQLMADPEVVAWLQAMGKLALIPKKRSESKAALEAWESAKKKPAKKGAKR